MPRSRSTLEAALRGDRRRSPRRRRPGAGRLPWVVVAAGVLLVIALAGRDLVGGDPGGPATVVRAVDGDTLVVRLGGADERVRLIGIDTPETKDPRTPVECFGAEAARRLAELLPEGTAVRLERDVEARDRYDRLLAYVHRADDGVFVNLAMVEGGFAAAATYPPNVARTAELTAAAGVARSAGRGLWSACGGGHVPAG